MARKSRGVGWGEMGHDKPRNGFSPTLPPLFLFLFVFSYKLNNSHVLPSVVAGNEVVFRTRIKESPYSVCDRSCVHISTADCTFHCLNLDRSPPTYEHLMLTVCALSTSNRHYNDLLPTCTEMRYTSVMAIKGSTYSFVCCRNSVGMFL